jgi:hypothetical protein
MKRKPHSPRNRSGKVARLDWTGVRKCDSPKPKRWICKRGFGIRIPTSLIPRGMNSTVANCVT